MDIFEWSVILISDLNASKDGLKHVLDFLAAFVLIKSFNANWIINNVSFFWNWIIMDNSN